MHHLQTSVSLYAALVETVHTHTHDVCFPTSCQGCYNRHWLANSLHQSHLTDAWIAFSSFVAKAIITGTSPTLPTGLMLDVGNQTCLMAPLWSTINRLVAPPAVRYIVAA